MNPLILIPLSACILTSCSLTEWNATRSIPTDIPSVIQTGALEGDLTSKKSDTETTETLKNAYSEELLARDIYKKIITKYPNLSEINNIIRSEDEHREQVGKLLDTRGVARPTGYGIYTETEKQLTQLLESNLTGAIEVGVMIETGDIDHLLTEYKTTPDTDIRQVFENIGGGSYNHLRAFLRMAESAGYTPKTQTTNYLSPSEISQSGSLKHKMTELLKANNLPTSGVNMGGGQGHGRNNH